jgi:hypothetical protein
MNEVIENGVPVPKRESKYAVLEKLEVGQSTVINVPRSSSLSKTIAILQRRTGRRFKRQRVAGQGVRVWRIEPPAAEAPQAPFEQARRGASGELIDEPGPVPEA